MISTPFLAHLRGTLARFLTDTCTIERETPVTDEFGSVGRAREVTGAAVACRVIKAGSSNSGAGGMDAGAETMEDTYRLIVPYTTTLDIDYIVTVGGLLFSVVRLETDLTDKGFKSALITRRR